MSISCDHDRSVWAICENVKIHGFLRHICKYNIKRCPIHVIYTYMHGNISSPSFIVRFVPCS